MYIDNAQLITDTCPLMKIRLLKPFRRAMAFIESNGGWRSAARIALGKIRRAGVVDAIKAAISHSSPVPLWPQWRYRRFIKLVERVPEHNALLARSTSLRDGPHFLILLRSKSLEPYAPQARKEVDAITRSIDSVREQIYDKWHLRIVTTGEIDLPEPLADAEHDIDSISLPDDTHAARASYANAVCEASEADFLILMKAGDLLRPHSLLEVAEQAADTPVADFIYSDEDRIDHHERRHSPVFKPKWSPDTLMAWHYTGDLCAYRLSLVKELGGLRPALEDAMEYDLALRVSERARQIKRIPKVLFHRAAATARWRKGIEQPQHAQARREALARRGIEAEVEERAGHSRIRYALQGDPLVSIIIPTRDHLADVSACLDSLDAIPGGIRREIILIDNGSRDPGSLSAFRRWEQEGRIQRLRVDIPFNFSTLNNRAARHAQGDVLLFLNNDTEVIGPEDWLARLTGAARQRWIGAVGAKLLYPNGTLQHVGVAKVGEGPTHVLAGFPADYPHPRCQLASNWSAVTAACLAIEKEKFLKAGGFDNAFGVTYNDVALCFALLDAGLYNQVLPEITLTHHEFRTRGNDRLEEEKRQKLRDALSLLYTRWPRHRDDPGYNPNLSTSFADFMPRN